MTYPHTQKEIKRALKDLHTTRFSLDSLRNQRRYCNPEDVADISDRIAKTAAFVGIMDDAIAHIPPRDQEVLKICMEINGPWQSTLADALKVSQSTACHRLHRALRSMQIALTGKAENE